MSITKTVAALRSFRGANGPAVPTLPGHYYPFPAARPLAIPRPVRQARRVPLFAEVAPDQVSNQER